MPDISHKDTQTILSILKKTPLLEELNEDDHKEIISRITMEYFPKGHIIFKEGMPGDSFFIIKRGMVRVFHDAEDQTEVKEIAMLGDNDFFGEMALIKEKPRNATTQAVEETEAFKLNKDDFINLVSTNHGMASRISSEFLRRFKINVREEADNQ